MSDTLGNNQSEDTQSDEDSGEELRELELKWNKTNENSKLKCTICSQHYTNIKSWKQHLQDHIRKHQCDICKQSFSRIGTLRLHQENKHNIVKKQKPKHTCLRCDVCNKTFGKQYNLTRHNARRHGKATQRNIRTLFSCRHCNCDFENYDQLFSHVSQNHPLNQQGGRRATTTPSLNTNDELQDQNETLSGVDTNNDLENKKDLGPTVIVENDDSENRQVDRNIDERALNYGVVNRNIEPSGSEKYDVLTFFGNVRERVRSFLRSRLQDLGGIKWNLCVQVEMQRDDANQDISITSPHFRSRTYVTLSLDEEREHDLNEAMQKMFASLEKFMREGSGWYVKKVLKLEIHTVVYKPLRGSGYLPLPKSLALSRSLLNITNLDDKCFLYCLLASLHPTTIEAECVESYLPYEHEVNMLGINYPVKLSQIEKVENQNETISVNVFTYENKEIIPLRITEQYNRLHHTNLLWLTYQGKSHYCLITNLNHFLSRTSKHRSQLYFCPYCLHGFYKERSLQEHQQYCSRHGAQRVELPIAGQNDILKFNDFEKTLKVPFVIYADFETVNRKIHTCSPNPNHSSTTPTTKLEVCGFGYKVVCEDEKYTKPSVIYRGENAGRRLIECLLGEEDKIREILRTIEPMHITEEHDNFVSKALQCCLCKKQFTTHDKVNNRIVRHHNHLTGEIIGAACKSCNLKCTQARFIPVIFHNLKNFDAHILCENIGEFKDHRLTCIAQNTEKYVSFSLGKLRFIDSLQFLPASLETLVNDLAQDGVQVFTHLLSETNDLSEAQLLLGKGIYPYSYVDCFEKFYEPELPSREHFYCNLKREHVSEENYQRAQLVFHTFGLTSLGEYHDLYLKTDVVLLSDVFEAFRNLCLKQYELDPCHFYTSPGISWSACLKISGVELELLTDIDKILMVEVAVKGGCSQVSHRHKKSNNQYLPDYDSSKPKIFIQYLDANNLYGWAMVQPLPVSDFAFMDDKDIRLLDIMAISEDSDTGYILEVSLHYPKHLHDEHNCLPLAPVRKCISNEELSPYAQHLLRKLYGLADSDPLPNRGKVEKLLTTFEDKDHYVLHYRNLQLYLSLGMKLKTIHRILKFTQKAWMKSYIDQNTEKRQKATSTFQKNFYKLLNVSVFGKTIENMRLHKNVELVHTEARLKKVTAKPSYKTTTILNENLVAVQLYKTKVKLFKPIYCGMSILDLSKCLMYDFWYNYIKKKYQNSAELLMTDTDSLLFSCETDDLYKDMEASLDYFDTSDYPKEHFLHTNMNKRVLGKFKDGTFGVPIKEFIGLRPKAYSFICADNEGQKRAKGVAKIVVKKDFTHELYKNTLFGESSIVSSMNCLRSRRHELFGETIKKTGLSAFDDKRYLTDAVNSYAYKHYKIAGDINSDSDGEQQKSDQLIWTLTPAEECIERYKKIGEPVLKTEDFIITSCVKP